MNIIETLERRAARVDENRADAVAAMVALARLCGEGTEGVAPDLHKALGWAEKAAYQDSPDGYLEITRIIGSACIATGDHGIKKEYAKYVVGTCDPDTTRRFGRPEIAYNVGTVCEYMAQFGRENGFHDDEINQYYETAALYYSIAIQMPFPTTSLSIKARFDAKEALARIGDCTRPVPKIGFEHPRQAFH